MSDIQEYKISINFSTKNADKTKKDIDKIKDSTADLKKSSSGISKLTSSFGGLASALKGFVAVKTFEKLGQTIFNLSSKTSDYIETINLFRASMGDAANKAQEFIDKAEDMLGLDPSQMMNSISQFYNLAQGIGIASDSAYTMSQNLTQLAGDLSSFANISFETAQQKLMSGFSGQVKPLREYGIALDQASLQETAYALGIDQKVKSMTRAQKTELIYYQIMKSTQKIQGDLGRSLLTPANSLRIMKTEFTKLARAVGSIFIPIIMKIIPVVRAVTQVLTQAAQAIASFFGFQMSDFNADLSSVGNLLGGISDDIDDVGDSAEDSAKKLNKMLMPFDELNNISLDTGSSGAGDGAGVGSGGSLGIELPTYDMFASMSETMDTTIANIKSMLTTLFEPIQKSWDTYGQGVIDSFKYSLSESFRLSQDIGSSLMEVWTNGTGETTMNIIFEMLTNIFNIIGDIKGAFANAWESDGTGTAIIQALWDGFNNLLTIINGVFETIQEFTSSEEFQRFADAIMTIIKTVAELFETITEKAKDIWEGGLKDEFQQFLGLIARIGEIVSVVFQVLQPAVEWIISAATPVIQGLVKEFSGWFQMLSGLIDFLIGIFTGDWERAWDGIKGIVEGFGKAFEGLWEAIKGVLGAVADFTYKTTIEPIVNMFKNFWEIIKNGFSTAFNWIKDTIITPISNFFSEMWEGFKNAGQKAWEGIKSIFSNVANFFKDIFTNAWNNVKAVFSTGGKIFDGIKEGISNAFKTIVNAIIRGINKVVAVPFNAINSMLGRIRDIEIAGFKPFTFIHTFNVPEIPQLAEGGFPQTGQLFIANEAGPELIGNIGNRTAVANRDQITTAIANATYQAMSRALAENGQNDGQPIIVNVGNEQLYRGFTRHQNQQSNMYGINV